MSSEQTVSVVPSAAIPGGEVSVECSGYDTSNLRECRVTFDGTAGQMVGAAPWRVMAVVPESLEGGGPVELVLESRDGVSAGPANVVVGRKLAEDLHMVANPAVDPDDGSVYVTRSGSRGQRMPVSLFHHLVGLPSGLNIALFALTVKSFSPCKSRLLQRCCEPALERPSEPRAESLSTSGS